MSCLSPVNASKLPSELEFFTKIMQISKIAGITLLGACGIVMGETSDDDGFKTGSNNTIGAGSRSIAAGWLNEPAEGSVAVGWDNSVSKYSFASGTGNSIGLLSEDSAAIGQNNEIVNSGSTVLLGDSNFAQNQSESLLAGAGNSISHSSGKEGAANILLGNSNEIDGTLSGAPSLIENSILIGSGNSTLESNAWVIGEGNIGQESALTVGRFGATTANAALIVGNGTGNGARSNAFVVTRDGEVSVPSGILHLGAGEAVTEASAATIFGNHLSSNGYLKKANGTGSSASTDSLLALGENSSAGAEGSIALGGGSTVLEYGTDSVSLMGGVVNAPYSLAVGGQSYGTYGIAMMLGMALENCAIAIGGIDPVGGNFPGNVAAGQSSTTLGGVGNRADGFASYASGFWTKAVASHSIALGSLNRADGVSSANWVETDPLFELGNGSSPRASTEPSPTTRSNAITTLKNGQTTLENKHWNPSTPLATTTAASEVGSDAEALVVKGHARLQGKVILEQPQGDILMGVFGDEPPVE